MTSPTDTPLIVPQRPHHRDRAAVVGLACMTIGLGLGGAVGTLARPRAETFTGPCPHGSGVGLVVRLDGATISCDRCGQPLERADLDTLRQRAGALECFLRAATTETTR
jgi:hypothetical protein